MENTVRQDALAPMNQRILDILSQMKPSTPVPEPLKTTKVERTLTKEEAIEYARKCVLNWRVRDVVDAVVDANLLYDGVTEFRVKEVLSEVLANTRLIEQGQSEQLTEETLGAHVDRLKRFIRESIEIAQESIQEQIEVQERRMQDMRAEYDHFVRRHTQRLNEKQTYVNNLIDQLETLSNGVQNAALREAYKKLLEDLAGTPWKVADTQHSDYMLTLETREPVLMTYKAYPNFVLNFGKATAYFKPGDTPYVSFEKDYSRTPGINACHPHVSSNGKVCWGTAVELVEGWIDLKGADYLQGIPIILRALYTILCVHGDTPYAPFISFFIEQNPGYREQHVRYTMQNVRSVLLHKHPLIDKYIKDNKFLASGIHTDSYGTRWLRLYVKRFDSPWGRSTGLYIKVYKSAGSFVEVEPHLARLTELELEARELVQRERDEALLREVTDNIPERQNELQQNGSWHRVTTVTEETATAES